MNALIPALLIVVLAEIGGPLAALAPLRPNTIAFVMALLIAAAAAIGATFTEIMTIEARTLMIGVVLILAGTGQLERAKPRKLSVIASGLTVWRSPAAFLTFALAAWSGAPLSAAVGAIIGAGAAIAAALGGVRVPRVVRILASGVLMMIGSIAALRGLRLV